MNKNSAIPQRISDFRALCAGSEIKYKEVTEAAGLNYESVMQNLRVRTISDERMTLLEETAIELREKKLQSQTV